MPTVITRTQYLEVNSVPLATPAWRILDLSRLHGLEVAGSDRAIPRMAGMRAYRRWVASRVVGLPLLVMGAQDREGNSNSDIHEGLDDNIDYLMTNVVLPPSAATQAAIWHRANGNFGADIHVEGFDQQAWGRGWVRFTLELSIPAGSWTLIP